MSPTNPEPLSTSILLIDGSKNQRTYWAEKLKHSSPDYLVLEAEDCESARAIFRSRRIDCIVLDLALPDQEGFKLLVELVRVASRPQVAVVVLTHIAEREVWGLAKDNGAYACLAKQFTTGEDLDRTIQRAMAFVGQMPKEDRHRPTSSL